MIDHISYPVRDFDRSLAFYSAALAPLGYKVLMQYPGVAGLGKDGKPDFWIGGHRPDYWANAAAPGAAPIHLAFAASGTAEVDAFYAAAIAAGGVDHGAPGPRPQYHPGYYGAFVIDPDGNNLEAVFHGYKAASAS